MSNARLCQYLIRGLWKEFMPFISLVQGWPNQPTIIELENLQQQLYFTGGGCTLHQRPSEE